MTETASPILWNETTIDNTMLNGGGKPDYVPDNIGGSAVGRPYLDTTFYNGGGLANQIDLELFIRPAEFCRRSARRYEGAVSGRSYFNFFPCRRWWCKECGEIKGPIAKHRVANILEKINIPFDELVLRQVVFTVPEELEIEFFSKDALNSLMKMTEKIIKKFFPKKQSYAVLHSFGDRGNFRFRPHVHILVVEKKGCKLLLPDETMQKIRLAWKQALTGYFRRPINNIVVHISFAARQKQKYHLLRYVLRPNPGAREAEKLSKMPVFYLSVLTLLDGFRYIRIFNGKHDKDLDKVTDADELKGIELLAGEKLIYVLHGEMTLTMFQMQWKDWEYEVLAPGWYRLNSS